MTHLKFPVREPLHKFHYFAINLKLRNSVRFIQWSVNNTSVHPRLAPHPSNDLPVHASATRMSSSDVLPLLPLPRCLRISSQLAPADMAATHEKDQEVRRCRPTGAEGQLPHRQPRHHPVLVRRRRPRRWELAFRVVGVIKTGGVWTLTRNQGRGEREGGHQCEKEYIHTNNNNNNTELERWMNGCVDVIIHPSISSVLLPFSLTVFLSSVHPPPPQLSSHESPVVISMVLLSVCSSSSSTPFSLALSLPFPSLPRSSSLPCPIPSPALRWTRLS